MGELVLKRDKIPLWISYIKRRIAQNKNFMGFIGGPTGSGKSWTSLSIAESLDSNFNIDRVVFTGSELMKQVSSDLPPGSVIVFEEAGIQMNNRNWQGAINKAINFLAQTFRHKRLIVIFNSPYIDFVDSATRRLFHAEFQTTKIDFKTKKVKLKPRLLQYNGRMGKMYYHRLVALIRGKGSVKIDYWSVIKPSDELLKLYEAKKSAFTKELNDNLMNTFIEQETIGAKSKSNKGLTTIQSEIVGLLKDGKTIDEISHVRGCNTSAVYRAIELIKNKGIVITPVKGEDKKSVIAYKVDE